MKLEPAVMSIIGWHAGKSIEEILEHKRADIKKIGHTIWFFQSWKAPIATVQNFGAIYPEPVVIFLQGSAYPTSTALEAHEMSRDKARWEPLPKGLGKVTGRLPGGGLVIEELVAVDAEIDLWGYVQQQDELPLRFQQGASTACVVPSRNGLVEGMKSRHRRVAAVGRLVSPYGIFLR